MEGSPPTRPGTPAPPSSGVATIVADELGAATIEMDFGVLRQVMGAALDDNRIARNPGEGVQLPKRKHADRGYLTHAQVATLDVYADLFDDDLDTVADRLDAALKSAADSLRAKSVH